MAWVRKYGERIALAAFLPAFAIGPLTLYALLVLGRPPVSGNLTAAHAMREKTVLTRKQILTGPLTVR